MDERTNDALVAAVAMSLYIYNVSSAERSQKIIDHFSGRCVDLYEMRCLVGNHHWATDMALPTALIYMQHAMDRYGEEAEERVQVNLE